MRLTKAVQEKIIVVADRVNELASQLGARS